MRNGYRMRELINECKDFEYSNSNLEKIMALAREIVSCDDGYTYARIYYNFTSKSIWFTTSLWAKYYDGCEDRFIEEAAIRYIKENFNFEDIKSQYIDIETDSDLIGEKKFEIIIEKPGEKDD